jgi:LPXTG-site transpeptidase (sortase) family protein
MGKSKTQLSPLRHSLLTKLLLITGLVFIIIPLLFYLNETLQLMYFVPKITTVKKSITVSLPTRIEIPAVKIDLQVEQTVIHNNTWTISQNGISHLDVSASPGENGPIILYSHNTNSRFGPIRWLNKGSSIILTTADGKKHTYTIIDTKKVKPDELSVFFSRKNETLYLYTCDGFADLERYIIIAEPVTTSDLSTLK